MLRITFREELLMVNNAIVTVQTLERAETGARERLYLHRVWSLR